MKPIKNLNIVLICVLLLFLGNCQKCKKDPAPDPCLGVKKANFKIYETVKDSLFETDKAIIYNFVTFEADGDYDSYTWTIGDDTRTWTTKKVVLRFTVVTDVINIKLVATRKPRPDCIPNDTGTDTIIKPFQIVEHSQSLVLGKFKGYSREGLQAANAPLVGNPLDTFTVRIYNYVDKPFFFNRPYVFYVDNFKKGSYVTDGSNNPVLANDYTGYRAILNEDGNFFVNNEWYMWLKGWHVVNKANDSITIKGYYYGFSENPKKNKNIEFKGKRL